MGLSPRDFKLDPSLAGPLDCTKKPREAKQCLWDILSLHLAPRGPNHACRFCVDLWLTPERG